jgi:hypothetical protein
LDEVDLVAVIVDQRLQERAELVGMINENLQNFFDFYRLLIRTVRKLRSDFLAASNPDYLTGNDLHMVHKTFLTKF